MQMKREAVYSASLFYLLLALTNYYLSLTIKTKFYFESFTKTIKS